MSYGNAMDLTRLRHIIAVARTQSFSRAAEEEGITQPALSRSIAAFEKRQGVILFDRGRGGVHPTSAGLHVIKHGRKLLAAAGDLERSLRHFPDDDAGRIAIGVGPLVASLFLPRISSALLTAFPGIQIRTLARTPDQLMGELMADRIEMILGNNWNLGRIPGIDVERLGRLEVAMVARAGHPLATGGPVASADLDAYPVASAIELPVDGTRGTGGSVVCDNFHVLREVVLQSDCVWISSPAFLADDLLAGRLARITVHGGDPGFSDISLISRRDRTRSPAARTVATTIRALMDGAAARR